MDDQKQKEKTPNVYKTSKTTWFLIAFMVIILIVIIVMMTRKKKDGAEGVEVPAAGMPAPGIN